MAANQSSLAKLEEPSIDTDKLSYEIFSILESNFLFGYDDPKLWKQQQPVKTTSPVVSTETTGDVHQAVVKNQRGKICVLCIDGGGMRSILAGKALEYLEDALKVKSGDPNARIADYFDVAAGTGVGGVFTAMLFGTKNDNRPIFKAEDTWKFVAEKGKRLYQKKSKSSGCGIFKKNKNKLSAGTGSFENVIKDIFTVEGKNLTLKNTLKPVLIPCYDLSSSAPFLFSRADALESNSFDFRLWEVCRATTALPGEYDHPVAMKSVDGKTQCVAVDGGLAMSNPTAAAITHVLHNKQEFPFVRGVEDLLVVSLGTGQLVECNYSYNQVKGWKAKDWARPMARISGDSSADMVDHAVSLAFGQTRSSNYVRIQANGSNMGRCGVNVDSDSSPANIRLLTGIADEMLKQKNVESVLFGGKKIDEQTNFEKLDWFASELVLEHQRRSCRIAPTVAFKQPTHP